MKTTTWDDASEPQRLAALRRICALNTPLDPAPDRSVTLTGKLPHAAILLVSLIDESRLWFKARLGLDTTGAPRDQAFCVHTIEGAGVMVVHDRTGDSRFRINPLVPGRLMSASAREQRCAPERVEHREIYDILGWSCDDRPDCPREPDTDV